ncbi:Uncharacterised protein [Mycobacteroides abscessus subsp. abscessus]|nr:Uncharacterised protein [Mycobacteroides abscessus subsp. abscessus]
MTLPRDRILTSHRDPPVPAPGAIAGFGGLRVILGKALTPYPDRLPWRIYVN